MTNFPSPPPSSAPRESDDLNLRKLVDTLSDHRWFIVSVTGFFLLAGYFNASSQPRIYQADALVQIETRGSNLAFMESLGEPQQGNPTSAELEILQSRMVLGETTDRLDLAIQVEPRRLPVVGDFLVHHGVNQQWFESLTPEFIRQWLADSEGDDWNTPYVWAGESLRVARFDVPEENVGSEHVLRLLDGGEFELLLEEETLLTGSVGETVQNDEMGYRLFVSQAEAHPGAEFTLVRTSALSAIGELKKRFEIIPRGLESGVYELTLNGADQNQIQPTLDTLTSVFLTQNVQRHSEEAENQIAFLNEQIPQVSNQLSDAEGMLNDYRAQRDSVDLTFETQNLLTRVVDVENQLGELAMREADLAERYRPSHPNYQTLLRQRGQLEAERDRLNALVSELPETQQEVLRLTRDTQVNQQVYVQLLNQLQEMRLVKAGTVGNVRILDAAMLSPGTIAPRIPLITAVSGLFGALLAILLVIVRMLLSRSIKTPEQLEELGLPVYATLPNSGEQAGLTERIRPRRSKKSQEVFRGLLAVKKPAEIAVEALRGLRTSLYFAMLESDNNRLMITGASPGVGKSFIAANLAAVCAQAGQKVLLIDADMRRGHLHHAFHGKGIKGLSELLARRISMEEAIRHSDLDGLDYVARGSVPPNPSELLMQQSFHDFLDTISQHYDLVIVDTPPILAVTDASVVGKLVGTSLMVVRFDTNPPGEIKAAKRRLESAGVRLKGGILNGVKKPTSSRHGYYGSYLYAYR
ncbi:polysaccharide biosynthesis tyrosine autokinase [Halomonas sp. QX-2]|jgi:tyrosine-protein kinase Etk/Wzc|uniref:Polysaccharide biosynthesis tyrosine autokinase n=1 Tax=Vreelandella sedimenti TaxID=2729618 RepID=A0A7Z0SPU9_9GAMM|nr:polysaccharide biosynthesis tyrosine autokinase [Halomonas sedimenti]NYT72939.1 polysaccharide biosynthesis tyrosine autokinase [Halomonas sedimenti]|tara:strand:+ start:6947 stop:9202 length:2256 start_codon:yes stop_codon:yes gene_type:complete